MSLSTLLLLSIALAALPARAQDDDDDDLGFCASSPPFASENKEEDVCSPDSPPGWTGPHECFESYCIYANRHLAGGIVAITDATNAKRLAALPDLFPLTTTTTSPPYRATTIPGKGTGLIATRPIARGEPIMAHQPTYLIHRHLDATTAPAQHLLSTAVTHHLPAARRAAFLAQMGATVSDIMLTNSFQVALLDDEAGHHLGSFPAVSRFNHDCRPNVAFRVDPATLAHYTHAVRDVAVGEELTLAYMNPLETRAVRQRHVWESWGFRCGCAQCVEADEQASDARLYEIEALEAKLGVVGQEAVSVAMVERLLELYRVERLHVKMHGPYVLAALNYNLFGDAKKARKYAEL